MIVVDTSALMAIVLDEPGAQVCVDVIDAHDELLVAAGTMAEALIVAKRRNVFDEMTRLFEAIGLEVIALTPAAASRVADAYSRWGKGIHNAGLNFGDCFAYELAMQRGCPLLYIGDDFSKTDVMTAVKLASR
jgi:ribonuclease VapC